MCDRSWVSWYNALITQSFRMPSPLENTVSKTTGKTRLQTTFSRCYDPRNQFSVHACSCSGNYVAYHLYIYGRHLFTIDAWVNSDLISQKSILNRLFLSMTWQLIAAWCTYLGLWITSEFNFSLNLYQEQERKRQLVSSLNTSFI